MEVIFIILIIIFAGTVVLWRKIKSGREKSNQKKHIIESIRAIAEKTGSEIVAQQILWCRDDVELNLYKLESRYEEKIEEICQNPTIAYTAFRTSLTSLDSKIQYVGIIGLLYLQDPRGVQDLMEDFELFTPENISVALNSLVQLSSVVPKNGDLSYFSILAFILKSSHREEKLRSLESLLRYAAENPTLFSEDEYTRIEAYCRKYGERLINSGTEKLRHEGEGFRITVSKITEQRVSFGSRSRKRNARENTGAKWHWGATPKLKRYYKILQVDPIAEPEEIKMAYRRLAAKYHPDVNKSSEASQIMIQINEAYSILKDPAKREEYDENDSIE
jgi:hypothetical protein